MAAGVTEMRFASSTETFSRKEHQPEHRRILASYAQVCGPRASIGVSVRGYLSRPLRTARSKGGRDGASRRRRRAAGGARRVVEVRDQRTPSVAPIPGRFRWSSSRCWRAAVHQVALHFNDTRGTALANCARRLCPTGLPRSTRNRRFSAGAVREGRRAKPAPPKN